METKKWTAIVVGIVIIGSLLFLSTGVTVPRQHNILYRFSSYDVEVYPEYHYTALIIEPEQEVFAQYSISIGSNDEMQVWGFEMYE